MHDARPAGSVLDREQPLAGEGARCRIHFTDVENCIEEHGLDLLEPITFFFLGNERH